MIELHGGSATDVGLVRTNNEDRFLVAAPLFAVADGMGGHAAGEVAAATAVEVLQRSFGDAAPSPAALGAAAQEANRAVWERAQADLQLRGMGTTLVAIALVPRPAPPGGGSEAGAPRPGPEGPGAGVPEAGPAPAPEPDAVAGGPEANGGPRPGEERAVAAAVAVASVGDSRVYRLHGGQLEQLTTDHSLVAELVAEGQLVEEEAEFHPQRNVLTRALGVDPEVHVDLRVLDPEPGDRYLLCSDGLTREVSDDQIAALLRRFADPTEASRELVAEARLRGGNDNITVVVVDVAEGTPPAAPPAGEGATTALEGVASSSPGPRPPATPGGAVEPPPAGRRTRWWRRRGSGAARDPRRTARLVTPRVVGFLGLLGLVVAVGVIGVIWYARSGYFVGLQGDQLVIFKGRPGGVLWLQPTPAQRTGVTTDEVEPRWLGTLRAGQQEPSLSAARQYVTRLRQERQRADAAGGTAPAAGIAPATGSSSTGPATAPAGPAPGAAPAGAPARPALVAAATR